MVPKTLKTCKSITDLTINDISGRTKKGTEANSEDVGFSGYPAKSQKSMTEEAIKNKILERKEST